MASNGISITDLTNALKPLLTAINTLSASVDVRLHELHELAIRVDAKLDRLEHPNVEIEQPKVARKKVVKAAAVSVVKRKASSKKADSDDDTSHPQSEDEPEEEEEKPKPKPKSKAAPKAAAPKRVTVMSAFKDKYKEDPSFFDEYITEDVKLSLADEHPGLDSLTGDKLLALQLKVYYTFIKETYPDLLNELKAAVM